MGNKLGYHKIGFETMHEYISQKVLIINTLDSSRQDCLIAGTILYQEEEGYVNSLLNGDKKETNIGSTLSMPFCNKNKGKMKDRTATAIATGQ